MSFARGVLKGFLSQGLEQKAASDALLGDITKQTAVNLLNEKIPNFNKQLQYEETNYNQLNKTYGPAISKLAVDGEYIKTPAGMQMFIKDIIPKLDQEKLKTLDVSNFNFKDIQSQQKLDFKNRQKGVLDTFTTIPGGSGLNVSKLFLGMDQSETMADASTTTAAQPDMVIADFMKPEKPKGLFSSLPEKERIDFVGQGRLLFDELEKNDVTKMFRKNYEAGYDEKIHGPSKQAYAYNKFIKEFYGPRVGITYDQDVFGAKKDMSTQMTDMGTSKTNISADVPAVDTSNTFNFQGRNYFIPDRFKGQSLTEDIKKSIASQQNNTPITQNDQRVILAQNSINVARAQGDDEAVEAIKNQLRKDLGVSNLSELIK